MIEITWLPEFATRTKSAVLDMLMPIGALRPTELTVVTPVPSMLTFLRVFPPVSGTKANTGYESEQLADPATLFWPSGHARQTELLPGL